MAAAKYSVPVEQIVPFIQNDLTAAIGDTLSQVGVSSFSVADFEGGLQVALDLALEESLAISVPGLQGLEFVLGSKEETIPNLLLTLYPDIKFLISNINLGIRLANSLFKPVTQQPDGTFAPVPSADGKPAALQIDVSDISFGIDSSGKIDFTLFDDSVPLKFNHPFMIGDSGIVVETEEIRLYFSKDSTPPNMPVGSMGIGISNAKVHLPGGLSDMLPETLTMSNGFIGSGGLTGDIVGDWAPAYDEQAKEFTGNGAGSLFGFSFGLKKVEIGFAQSALKKAEIKGAIALPFFANYLHVDVNFDLNGNLSLIVDPNDPLLDFEYRVGSTLVFTAKIDSLGLERRDDDFLIHVACDLEPKVGLPPGSKFKIKDLMIDSVGNVSINGGWLNLPQQVSVDFHGFQMEITKIGFGSEKDGSEKDGTKWIGFSGGIKLVDGLPMGASVEGLRISWKDGSEPSVSFNGIGVQFEIAEVLRFTGAVSYEGKGDDHCFKGVIKLELISLGFSMDAALLIGKKPDHTYFYIFLDVQLPVGIPLFSTGLALYGMAGLFADNMEPGKGAGEGWYDNPDGSAGWYKKPKKGVTDVNKWGDQLGSLALGAGVTIGTLPDSGYAFSSSVLLVIVIPGPVILLEGRAQILKSRASLGEDAPFHALVVIDGRAGTFLFNVDATYRLPPSNGLILDAHAGAEGFFAGPSNWHFYLGQKEPRKAHPGADSHYTGIKQLLHARCDQG